MTNRSDLVAIGHAYGQADAALALSMLNAAGIPAVSQTGHALSVVWDHAVALGGTAILVPDSEAEAARAVLADYRPTRARLGPLAILFFVLAWFWAGLPPPASGYFPARAAPAPVSARGA